MRIRIRKKSYQKIAIAGAVLATPAFLLWLSAGLWSILGFEWLKAYSNFFTGLPNSFQLTIFALFPVLALIFGIMAVRKTSNYLSICVLGISILLVGLTTLIFV